MTDNCHFMFACLPLAEAPPVDPKIVISVLARVLHILPAIVLGGGLFYLRSILAADNAATAYGNRRAAWARWVGAATLLLSVTGLYNYLTFVQAGKLPGARELPMAYHMLFGLKFLLGIFVMFVAAILAGSTAAADRFRGNMLPWLNRAWIAVIAIVIIAAIMRSMH